jgi:hypothetical protein
MSMAEYLNEKEGQLKLNPGSRLYSTSCTTELVVVRGPAEDVAMSCCGAPMSEQANEHAETARCEGKEKALFVGKRYSDEVTGIELLCTKGGHGPLECDGRPLVVKASKPLPSSD